MTRTLTTHNNYSVTYNVSGSGGITITEVKKGRKKIIPDTMLRIRLINEISEVLEDEKDANEWEAMNEKLEA